MESIEEFEIHVDIADREFLHDYVSGKRIQRPATGKWDLSELKTYGRVENVLPDDENTMVRINLMDKALMDTRTLEKRKKESAPSAGDPSGLSEEFQSLVFDHRSETDGPPRRVLPVFCPGEHVRGNLVLKLKKAMKASRLALKFNGFAIVNIRVYHNRGYYDDTKVEPFIKTKIQLWQKSGSEEELREGLHSFPFDFQIPESCPQSCPPLVPHSADWGHLVYRLKGIIHQDNTFHSGDIATHQGIWVEQECDIGNIPDVMSPVTVEEKLDTGVIFKTGKVSVKATISQGGYLKGNSVPLRLEIDNQTSGTIKKVKARLRLYGKIQHGEGKLSLRHSVNVKGEKITEGPVAAGMCPVYDWVLPWDFSQASIDNILMPVGDLDQSKLIDINYEVDIEVKRSGLHRNLDIHIPIKIGNKNSRASAEQEQNKLYPTL